MKIIIIILQAILNLVRKRRDLIANTDKIPPAIKKSIIAWYSPKKQKLNNYDVIESYAEDFTRWRIDNTGVTTTQKKITIAANTELKYNIAYKDFGNSTDGFDIKYTGNIVMRYRYHKEDGTEDNITIDKSGIYHLPASVKLQKNFGFYCNPQTVTEEATIEILPTSILKDFSGNGLDAYLYGFKGKLNSGVGIYAQDFKNWNYGSKINNNISTKSYNKFHIVKKKADDWFGFTIGIPKNNYYNQSYKLKFSINKKIDDIKFSVVSTDGNLQSTQVYSININDGSVIDVPIVSEEIFNNKEETNIYYDFGTNKDIEIDIELIADYPNQLCYDGKSYAVAYGLPILTDYTVIADRTWFAEKVDNGVFMSKALEQNGAFILEYKQGDKWNTYSYYSATNINIDKDNSIVYQTKNKYNEQTIYPGDKQDTDTLFIGTIRKDDLRSFIGCHGDILLFNRTLTDDEINDITKAVFKEDILKPTFDLKATDVIDVVNDRGGELTEYTDIYGVNYTFNNFTLGDAVGNKDYPNALYFTPNKQKIRFAPNKAIKTVIIDGIFYETCVVYDSRDGDYDTNFALYTGNDGENYIAWDARANNAKTYINGELNTTIKGTELYGIRHITAMTKNASSAKVNTINGIDPTFNNKLIIYRITGFDYELTPNQIKNWYEQNKPE